MVKRTGSPKGKLAPAPADSVQNLENTVKHSMCLRPRSGSVPPTKSAFKKKPSDPSSSAAASASQRARKKSPEKKKKSQVPAPVDQLPNVPCMPDRRIRVSKKKEMTRYLEYNLSRMIFAPGFTAWERSLCHDYLIKRDYEFLDPVPEEYQYEMKFIREIRITYGYGLTSKPPPRYIGKNFDPYYRKWKEDAEVQAYVEKMIGMVLDDIKIRIKDTSCRHKAGKGIDNLVRSNWTHLLSFEVEDTPKTDHRLLVAEAYFVAPPLGPIIDNLNLLEWKIRKNDHEVIFCTEDILDS